MGLNLFIIAYIDRFIVISFQRVTETIIGNSMDDSCSEDAELSKSMKFEVRSGRHYLAIKCQLLISCVNVYMINPFAESC